MAGQPKLNPKKLKRIEALLKNPMTRSEIESYMKLSNSQTRAYVSRLKKDGKVHVVGETYVQGPVRRKKAEILQVIGSNKEYVAPKYERIDTDPNAWLKTFVPRPDWSFAWLFDRNQYPVEKEGVAA